MTAVLLATQHLGASTTIIFATLSAIGSLTTILGILITRRAGGALVGVLLAWVGFDIVFLAGRDVYYRSWLADPTVVPLNTKVVAVLDESGWWLFAAIALLCCTSRTVISRADAGVRFPGPSSARRW